MKSFIRKNKILPSHLDAERFLEVFEYIKAHPEMPQSQNVEKVLELISSFRDDLSTREEMKIFTRLRLTLATYRWSVRLSPSSEGLHVVHEMAEKYDEGTSEANRWEYGAISLLLDILPYLGNRPRIRRCANAACRQWFFAVNREDQEFCSGNCRQHHYDSDPQMRKKKREYMRKRRIKDRERDEEARRAIGFRGRVKRIRIRRSKQSTLS